MCSYRPPGPTLIPHLLVGKQLESNLLQTLCSHSHGNIRLQTESLGIPALLHRPLLLALAFNSPAHIQLRVY